MRQFRLPLRRKLRHDRHPDRQYCTGTVAPVARDDPSAQRFDKTAADRQTETGAGTPAVLGLDPVELVEDALEIGGRDPGPLIDDLDLDEFPVALRADIDAAAGRGIFRGIVEQIEQHLLEQHRVYAQHRQARLDVDLDPMSGDDIPGPLQRRADDFGHIDQLSLNSIAPDSRRVMSRRLATNRFRRSASSCRVPSNSSRSVALYFSGKLRRLDTVPRIEASGVRRSCEIEVSSAARSRSVSASTRASSSPLASEIRSIATAAWSHSASSSRRSSGVSNGPPVSRSIPITPTGPLPVRNGKNNRLTPGKVSAPRPAARLCSQVQRAAAISAASSWSSGG